MSVNRPRVAVLGTGFAAFSFIKEIDVERYDVFIVSPRNHFLFTPLLPSTTVGTVEFRSIIEPIRVARKGIRYYQAYVDSVDMTAKTLLCKGAFKDTPFVMEYDILIIGVGSVSNTFNVPGVTEHSLFLRELADARAIRQKILECFERGCKPDRPEADLRALLHFVVVGGGPTGVEFAAEMHDFATEDLAKWYPDLQPFLRITLLEAQDAILTSFDKELGAYALKQFHRMKVDIRTNSPVKEVREDAVVLSTGEEIPYGLLVWSTGIGPTDFCKGLDVAKDKFKRLITDEAFCLPTYPDVFAIGDCAVIPEHEHPPTAQVAQQEGRHLAETLNRRIRGKKLQPFKYKHMGMLAYIGDQRALADLKNVKGKGRATWIFWRSAYLTKLVSFKNKLLVLQDWMKTYFFGRDISRF